MSRNFGIPRRAARRPKFLSNRTEDFLLFIMLLTIGAGLLVLQIEFPRGWADIADLHIAFVTGR